MQINRWVLYNYLLDTKAPCGHNNLQLDVHELHKTDAWRLALRIGNNLRSAGGFDWKTELRKYQPGDEQSLDFLKPLHRHVFLRPVLFNVPVGCMTLLDNWAVQLPSQHPHQFIINLNPRAAGAVIDTNQLRRLCAARIDWLRGRIALQQCSTVTDQFQLELLQHLLTKTEANLNRLSSRRHPGANNEAVRLDPGGRGDLQEFLATVLSMFPESTNEPTDDKTVTPRLRRLHYVAETPTS